MAGNNTYHDNNHVPVLAAVSSSDGSSIVLLWADPVTHRLLTTGTGGSTAFYSETPTGLINGSNTSYTTTHTMNTVLSFAINGQMLQPDTASQTNDFSYSGTTITMHTALPISLSGTAFTIVYV